MSPHRHVPHPRDLLHKQPGLTFRAFCAPGVSFLARTTSRLAFVAAALYGGAATILVFLIYSVLSGLAKGNLQLTLLTWSNGVQLVFCAVMTYVGNQLAKQAQAKSDADHEAQTHIATQVDQVADRLDEHTAGGIRSVLDAIDALARRVADAQVNAGAGGNPAESGLAADERVTPPAATARKLQRPEDIIGSRASRTTGRM